MLGSPAPGACGLQSFLVSPLIEPLDIVAASQKSVSRLQFTTQQVQEVIGKVTPPVVDLAHYNVSGPLGISKRERENVHNEATFMFTPNK